MEDGESGVLIQRDIRHQGEHCYVIDMAAGEPLGDHYHLCTEVALRGFWMNYHAAMGFDRAAG